MEISELLAAVVARAVRHARAVVAGFVLLALACGFYAERHLGVTTNTDALFSNKLLWKQREMAYARLFPQFTDQLVVVIDGRIPEEADATAASLAAALRATPGRFASVVRPDDDPYLAREALLFLDRGPLEAFLNQTIDAQPFIGQLVADPSARGLFSALSLVALGVQHGQTELGRFAPALDGFERALAAAAAGRPRPLSWEKLLGGGLADQAGRFDFVLVQPELDYDALQPGGAATASIRRIAAGLPFVRAGDARVRITGSVALADEEFATVAKGAAAGLAGSFVLVVLWLFLALRSWRLILPVVGCLLFGLLLTTGFAAVAVGTLNLISVAFAILFVGIAVDFAIQFTVRFRELSFGAADMRTALDLTARRVGPQILIAAIATASGFLAFTPTAFVGVALLGLIAGAGMLIAFVCTVTILPALLVLARPRAARHEVGIRQLKRADILVGRYRVPIVVSCVALLAAGVALTSQLRFDSDPLHTKDPNTESMRTLADLMRNPLTTPYNTNTLVPSIDAAVALAARLAALPTVGQTVTLASFVPDDQAAKLALVADANSILGATLIPPADTIPPSVADLRLAIASTVGQIDRVSGRLPPDDPLVRIGRDLRALGRASDDALRATDASLVEFLPTQLDRLRLVLSATPATLGSIPPALARDWSAPDGHGGTLYRVQATERIAAAPAPATGASTGAGRARRVDPGAAGIERFVDAVRAIDPQAGGPVVSIMSTTHTILSAFRHAAAYAVAAIAVILLVSLRRLVDAGAVLASLLLSAALTVIVSVLLPLPLNFANIIALPLLLGVGVSFNIYFVMNWRAGESSRLASPTARAVIFSALTTGTAFGSLALSAHPGTASMGALLLVSLAGTLFGSLVFIPALLAMLSRSSQRPDPTV